MTRKRRKYEKSQPVESKSSRRPAKKEDLTSVYEPINEAQVKALNAIDKNNIIFLLGPAGTSKTHTATAYSIMAARQGYYENIVFTRPVVEASESLGYLPGDVNDKIAPYMRPLQRCAEKVGKNSVKIETIPIAYLRGITFENSVCILDEAQNCTRSQLKLYLTRYGKNSKMIICGDASQTDIKLSGLARVADDLKDIEGICVFYFRPEDNVRHPLVEKIASRLTD